MYGDFLVQHTPNFIIPTQGKTPPIPSPAPPTNQNFQPPTMSNNKRPNSLIGSIVSKSGNLAKRTAVETPSGAPGSSNPSNPFMSRPTPPEMAIKTFLIQARSTARNRPASQRNQPVEIEARLGTIISPYGSHNMRVMSSGAKQINIKGVQRVFHAFVCNISPGDAASANAPKTNFEGGITRSN
jgi:hypothetical protein